VASADDQLCAEGACPGRIGYQRSEQNVASFTGNAIHTNAENMAIVVDSTIACLYEQNFESRLAASEPLDQYEAAHQK
jgi:hypothetical protein